MSDIWKRKLAAFLHDPPSKALDIRTHGERSDEAFKAAGFVDSEVGDYFNFADHTEAAADRLPFPNSQASGLQCAFDGIRNAFRHPLCGTAVPFHSEFRSAAQGIEGEKTVQPVLTAESLDSLSENERWRAKYFAHWRLWPKHASDKDYRLALLPADTRIPDHTIWTHMQVVSALAGCVGKDGQWQPAFLKFQLGPVQDFIAAARSTRDLWSGSYLLSWLMAAGLKALSAEVGPDAVIFPNLREQPLFDLHWRKDLWSKVGISTQTSVWDSLGWKNRDLLTPNLPNVFLAIVPKDQGRELAERVCEVIQAEWNRISDAVWATCEQNGLTGEDGGFSAEARRARFDSQIRRFLSLSWQITPWPETLEKAMQMADGFADQMPVQIARQRVQKVITMATTTMPLEDRDGRFYTDKTKTTLNNVGLGWSIILAINGWELDAVRQTRQFASVGRGGWNIGAFNNKDVLTGREEAVAGGKNWAIRSKDILGAPWNALFKHEDWLSAPTLVKRLWHYAYLAAEPWKLDTTPSEFPMPNTRGVAVHHPNEDCGDDETSDDASPAEKYFAVLALDGDEIGKWVSGEKTPSFETQLADYQDGSGNAGFGSKPYFERHEALRVFLREQRPLSPSYHIQFSEALSNFALRCAGNIVKAFDGRLIYAGGDDVLALLPADAALDCAKALRSAFQGKTVTGQNGETLFECKALGFLTGKSYKDDQGHEIPFIVPGPKADCSVGIAIAHFKAPLQNVVREAQTAEKRAKRELKRSAVAVTLFKRSGETIEWGSKWDCGGLDLYHALFETLKAERVSSKFPYRMVELIEPYITDRSKLTKEEQVNAFTSVIDEIIQREWDNVCSRQRGPKWDKTTPDTFGDSLSRYLSSLDGAETKVRAIIGLCQTVAFVSRNTNDDSRKA